MIDQDSLTHCRKLISDGKLDQCLHVLLAQTDHATHPYANDLRLLSAQYQAFVRNKGMGIETDSTTLNRITKAVLDFISSEEMTQVPAVIGNRTQRLPPQYLFWVGAILILVGLYEAEKRLTTSNDAFLYDFITLSYDYSNTYVSFDNAKAIQIAENAKEKINHYISINPGLRQKYITDLAYVTAYTAHVYAYSRDYQQANLTYLSAYDLYNEIVQPNLNTQSMIASFLMEYCDFLNNAGFFFPKLSKKELSSINDNKCKYTRDCIAKWKALPNDNIKMGNMNRLQSYLQSCN